MAYILDFLIPNTCIQWPKLISSASKSKQEQWFFPTPPIILCWSKENLDLYASALLKERVRNAGYAALMYTH